MIRENFEKLKREARLIALCKNSWNFLVFFRAGVFGTYVSGRVRISGVKQLG
jgi:hypothetical protein